MDDIWDTLTSSLGRTPKAASIQEFLEGTQTRERFASSERHVNIPVGLRVAFGSSLEGILAYRHPPNPGATGTVVMVRTSSGDRTSDRGQVFVQWDQGGFMAVDARHLVRAGTTSKVASSVVRVATATTMDEFLRVAGGSSNDLIHKATRDLWSMQTTENGDVVLARLFQENGEPLKV